MQFDWNDLAFASKKPLNNLKPIFILAPRTLSLARFTQLVKQYLPQGNILLGIAKEDFVDGFNNQPQFKMQKLSELEQIITKVNAAKTPHKIAIINYFQRDTVHILQKLNLQKAILINGSWKFMLHTTPIFYALHQRKIPYELISPFTDKVEAQKFESLTQLAAVPQSGSFSAKQMLDIANTAATHSYDHTFQTGAALGKKDGAKYQLLATGFNKVVPFQTYAMLNGSSREANFSPPNDQNHYDAIHAETDLLINVQKRKVDLKNTTLFINLLPCPACARALTQTDIANIVYQYDHSDGYGATMLQAAGKKITKAEG